MCAATSWTQEQQELLIDLYKSEPCLYAVSNANYHNKNLRRDALEKITGRICKIRPGTTEVEVKTKFKNLRSNFVTEHQKKVQSEKKSGNGADDVYEPSVWYYRHMLFLAGHVQLRKSKDSPMVQGNVSSQGSKFVDDEHLAPYPETGDETTHSVLGASLDCAVYDAVPWQEGYSQDEEVLASQASNNPVETTCTDDGSTHPAADPTASPATSVSSLASTSFRGKKRKASRIDSVDCLQQIRQAINKPIQVAERAVCSVRACGDFVTANLLEMKNKKRRAVAMAEIVGIIMKAKIEDLNDE